MKVLVTRRVRDFLAGTGAGQHVNRPEGWSPGQPIPPGEELDTMTLMCRVFFIHPSRKDKSVWVELDDELAAVLKGYLGAMEAVGADNSWDPDGRADASAARALLRKLS